MKCDPMPNNDCFQFGHTLSCIYALDFVQQTALRLQICMGAWNQTSLSNLKGTTFRLNMYNFFTAVTLTITLFMM